MQLNIKYRSDIDGLRALAVLSVIIFHINPNWIPGGFLGVDIFFVISGYLITLILIKEVDSTKKINITNFYKRRIKRIIPALLFVLITVFIVGFLLFAPLDLRSLLKSIVFSLFSMANIYFYSSIDTGYFASGSSELPLLHLWSLGVEEQFYILWPFLVLFLIKYVNNKTRLILVGTLFLGSFIWAHLTIQTNHSFAYYLLPTRAYELLAGAIAALLVHSGFRKQNITNELMALLGLLLIILSFIFVSESDPVPGIATLPVIIGASMLLLSGISYQTYVGRILSIKILVGIGLVSYAAYLWHWPILAFLRYAFVDIDLYISIFVIILTFILATISYFVIETPLRKKQVSTKSVFLWYFTLPTILITTASILLFMIVKHKSTWIYPEKIMNIMLPSVDDNSNCLFPHFSNTGEYTQKRCIYPKNNQPNVFLIGDSNAAHYLGMLRVFSDHYGFTIKNVTQSSCPLILNGEYSWIDKKYQEGCSTYRHSIKEQAMKYDTVIIGGSWSGYNYVSKEFKEHFSKTINELAPKIKNIIILGKVPIMTGYNNHCILRSAQMPWLNCTNEFINHNGPPKINHFIKKLARKYSNVYYFDITNEICKKGECYPYLDGVPLYYDAEHLNTNGSKVIGKEMIKHNSPMLKIFDLIRSVK